MSTRPGGVANARDTASCSDELLTWPFRYHFPQRSVRFGAGALNQLPDVLAEVGISRAFAIVTPSQQSTVPRIREMLGTALVHASTDVRARVPLETVEIAVTAVGGGTADGLLALGGGSATGLAKAVAAETRMPIVAIPTTYSGSEMTAIYGITIGARKHPRESPHVAPLAVIYDPELTLSMPAELTSNSGINALAQAIGSLYAGPSDPLSRLAAVQAIELLTRSLPGCVLDPVDLSARSEALLGAHLAGWALAASGLSAHHDLAHALGDLTRLPHAAVHAALLPQTTSRALRHHPALAAPLQEALDCQQPAQTLFDFLLRVRAPTSLRELGLHDEDFQTARNALHDDVPQRWRDGGATELDDVLARTFSGTRPPTTTT